MRSSARPGRRSKSAVRAASAMPRHTALPVPAGGVPDGSVPAAQPCAALNVPLHVRPPASTDSVPRPLSTAAQPYLPQKP